MFTFFRYDPVSRDEGRNANNQQERLDEILRNENSLMIKYFFSKIKRFIRKRMDYKFYWSSYYILTSMICGAIIAGNDHLPYMDGLFVAASAMTGAGLSTVAMYDLSRGSFAIMSILMMIGCAPFMILPPIRFRRFHFSRVKAQIERQRTNGSLPPIRELTADEQHIIKEYDQIYDALGVLRVIGILYYIGMLITGVFIINGALHLHPLPQELVNRNMSYFDYAAFLAVSAFGNAGFTLTTDNLVQLDDNPAAYIWISFLIVAGNTAFPIFLRMFINALVFTAPQWSWIIYTIKYRIVLTPAATISAAVQRTVSMEVLDANSGRPISQSQSQSQRPPTSPSGDDDYQVGEGIEIPSYSASDRQPSLNLDHGDESNRNDSARGRRTSMRQHGPSLNALQEAYLSQLQYQPKYESYRDEMIGLLNFILDNPRHVTTHLFSPIQTKVLAVMVLTLIIIQYVFFLCSTLTRPSVTEQYSLTQLAGLGYFQTLSTRSAGFNIMDLRALNQGLLFVYGIMMYLSAFPFVATLQSTTHGRVILIEEHGKNLEQIDHNQSDRPAVEREGARRKSIQDMASSSHGNSRQNSKGKDQVNTTPIKQSSANGNVIDVMKSTYDFAFKNDYRDRLRQQQSPSPSNKGYDSNNNTPMTTRRAGISKANRESPITVNSNYDRDSMKTLITQAETISVGNTNGSVISLPVTPISTSTNFQTSEPSYDFAKKKEIQAENLKVLPESKEEDTASSISPDRAEPLLSSVPEDKEESAEVCFYFDEAGNYQTQDESQTKTIINAGKKHRAVSIDELAEIEFEKERERELEREREKTHPKHTNNGESNEHTSRDTAPIDLVGEENAPEDADSVDPSDDVEDDFDTAVRKYMSSMRRRRRLSFNGSRGSVVIVDENNVNVVEINKKFAKQFLFRHSFFLIVAVLICAFSEDRMLGDPSIDVNLWYIMFEIISAYGNVGLTFGMPGEDYSLVGGMTSLGKFIIICVMWLGKHRGLPSSNDDVIDFAFSKYKIACRSETLALPSTPSDPVASTGKTIAETMQKRR